MFPCLQYFISYLFREGTQRLVCIYANSLSRRNTSNIECNTISPINFKDSYLIALHFLIFNIFQCLWLKNQPIVTMFPEQQQTDVVKVRTLYYTAAMVTVHKLVFKEITLHLGSGWEGNDDLEALLLGRGLVFLPCKGSPFLQCPPLYLSSTCFCSWLNYALGLGMLTQ